MKRSGWFYSLSKGSNWGSPEGLLSSLHPTKDSSVLRIDSEVWGKLLRKGQMPQPGDGFASYHAKRAEFPRRDVHKRLPRVSLVGIVEGFKPLKDNGGWKLSVIVSRDVAEALAKDPIVRNEQTAAVFARSGLGPGPFASFYPVSAKDWALVESWVARRLPSSPRARSLEVPGGTGAPRRRSPRRVEAGLAAFEEGAVKRRLVNRYERSAAARRQCIEHWGKACFVCGPAVRDKYGELGTDVIEVHHSMPLALKRETYTVDPVRDMKPLCPTCHAVIHRTEPPISVNALARVVVRQLRKKTEKPGGEG